MPPERMDMSNVVSELQRIRDSLSRSMMRGQHEIVSVRPQGVRNYLNIHGRDGVVAGNAKVTLPALHMQDVSSLLTLEKLDGTNYVEWALNAQNKIQGRKRWGFILDTMI
uniref:Retrotransposon Copia-like N-terminal domain-containing protein n=1 Tax=Populus alba TaxID=43335 RepID=A0A4U5NST8_POPAL|nr:hypothetical protein D5086_0000241980 [Populus alba]